MNILVGIVAVWFLFGVPRELTLLFMRQEIKEAGVFLPPFWMRLLGGPFYGQAWIESLFRGE